ncbi:hypothetical protein PVAND_001483 [Polypedilum vanderplanki]|uniref:CHK kinase-like domain-containing protein n=1 Tax=Polypedilum vanderplanki TaxID=319348 RepID=A0A9J6BPD0_POLVA|nr:hypothetical protein PVAND_001483 [Polypedilum vanderplanki]
MEDLTKIVEKIAIENGFKNFELRFEFGSDLGFVGLLKKCRIIEQNRELSVFCKFLPQDEEQNKKLNSFLLFEREVFIYNELFPEFIKLQLENGFKIDDSDGFWSFPKCYYANYDKNNPNKSVIIMEDLTKKNFEVKDKFIPSDFQHTSKLFIELAKLHGLSLALKIKKPEIFDKFKNLKNSMCFVMTTDSMKNIAPRNCQLICELFKDNQKVVKKLDKIKNCIWEKVAETLEAATKTEQFSVICHGDVWINNVLYNYSDKDKQIIKDIKLVDWQITYHGSLGSELVYYLYCCVDKCVRKKYQNELFELYYLRMKQMLSRFGLEMMSYEDFERQLQVYGIYAFAMANFAIPLLCKYPEKLFDDKNAILSDEEKNFVVDYEKRMKDIILEMIDMKIL